jgi:hypothetical protein
MRLQGSVSLRPVRIGLLVSPTDLPSIRRFMRLSACLWGGRYNPIIPMPEHIPDAWNDGAPKSSGRDMAINHITFFEPDVLVEAQKGLAKELGWQEVKSHLEFPRIVTLDEFYIAKGSGRVEFPLGIDSHNVFADLYHKEYKFKRRHKSPFAFFDPENQADAFFECVGGTYPSDAELKYIVRDYKQVFAPEILESNVHSYFKIVREGYRTPFFITRHELKNHNQGLRDPEVFIFDPKSPLDIVDFWNYRLINPDVLPINLNWIHECGDYLRVLIRENYRPLPDNPNGIMIHTGFIFARSIDGSQLKELCNAHFHSLEEESHFADRYYNEISRSASDSRRWKTKRLIAEAKRVSFDEEIDDADYVKLPAPVPDFLKNALDHYGARWANVIHVEGNARGIPLATLFPTNIFDPKFPRVTTVQALVITREGWVTVPTYELGYILLKTVKGRDAFISWLKQYDIDALPSDAGQVADQLIEAAENLYACGMFADLETLKLLNDMASSRIQWKHGKLQSLTKVPDRTKSSNEVQNHFNAREKRTWGYWGKLKYFLERSVFRAGMRVQCPKCAFYNWYDLQSLNYNLTCSRCLKEFSFNQSPDELRKINWYYRVIGPFATPDYAQGGYAVALTLRRFQMEVEGGGLTWSTGLNLLPLNLEVDFLAWYRSRSSIFAHEEQREPVLLVGESKSFGQECFNEGDIKSLKSVALRFPRHS